MKNKQYVQALTVKGLSVAALFGVQVLIAHMAADRGEFGFYNYLISILNLGSFIAIWGLDKFLVREVSVHTEEKQGSKAWLLVRDANRVIVLNLILAGPILAAFFRLMRPDRFSWGLVFAVWALLAAMCFARSSAAVVRGMQRVIASEAVLNLLRPLALGSGVLLFAAMRGPLEAESIVIVAAGAFAFSAVVTATLSRKTVAPSTLEQVVDKIRATKKLYRTCFPFLLIGVGLPLLSNLDVIILGSLGNDDQVGLYSACVRLITLTTVGLTSVNLLIAPRLPVLFRQGKLDEMQAIVRRNNIVIILLTTIPVLVLITAGGLVLSIFGEEFAEGEDVLHVLLIGQVINVFVGPVNLICMMAQQHRLASIMTISACVIEAALCYILIPSHGVHGAAWANVAAISFLSIALSVIVVRKVRVNPTLTNTLFAKRP
ncbi:MAG: oligosaccharide flippase family protein [Planctomycetes bacterium]|nr:oligosaccharide flippase family protein [Planctomycetota bacterium]MCP4860325.1 oligosaccharide flippase family protein [Planctomycetota bacterium]